ncbi:ABC-F family ATP-binding cassette domain-containing protein [Anaerotignum propionicum]|uniref:ABC transporter ATP-binding proteinc n=1 Tax=Anaerotignum propionicum DSM 1682 TaxID=991789 RepID=A0A0X8VBL0_ANAPI|nr:ABC-F family ATP-binding cassette domain-containing protein [Anaerotignum propionicum]AMJ40021.1 putative ABC transporter ATP-binding proteinc [Anaerotignum propionicum DSM 1682]SHE78816.1 ATP-binding cassette, subfamily F, uup [[Clostridium] propionicum DSM 1682] [Anaerotignum propionicum DSM 1682]
MVLLTAEHIRKSYGTRVIFDDISFSIHEGDKIGVIGVNGAGKSTLLKIVAGVGHADSGEVITMNGMRIAYLSQNPEFMQGTTILQHVFAGDNPKLSLVREYEETLEQLNANPQDKNMATLSARLTEEMDKAEAWSLESEAKNILTRLGILDFGQKVDTLSGGQKKRVALAAALIAPVELLILDEPTNHIDHDTVEWLEKHLEKYAKALLMVTHDRYFLDRVANRTLELDKGQLYSYQGNYTKFLELKAEREELESAGERKRQNFLRSELEWVCRGAQARSTKQKARLQRFDEVSAIKAPEEKQNVSLSSIGSRLGKKTIELENISKAYDGKVYIKDFSYIVLRDDRIGITGDNGCGKTTLLKIMIGKLKPDSGMVQRGETVKIGIFSQENEGMDESVKVLDYIREVAEYIPTGDGRISASQMLEKFLFPADMQRGPISMLSGGEKRRLYLARVLMGAPNILFLDEPTNDLDLETLMILEEYLQDFQGAVIAVSHDRYFLDKTVNRIFAFLGDGRIKQYEGGYSDFKAAKEKEAPSTVELAKPQKVEAVKEKSPVTKMSYKDQREYDTIGVEIAKIEEKIWLMNKAMEGCTTDYTELQRLSQEKEELELKLESRMERWMELTELAEEIEKNRGERG